MARPSIPRNRFKPKKWIRRRGIRKTESGVGMITRFECRIKGMSFKGYYDEKLGDYLNFFNCKGDDIGSRIPINPYNSTKQHTKYSTFEEIKEWIMTHYNILKIAIKDNADKTNYEIEYKKCIVIINRREENENPFWVCNWRI